MGTALNSLALVPAYPFPFQYLTLLHSEWPKLHRVLAVLSAKGLKGQFEKKGCFLCTNFKKYLLKGALISSVLTLNIFML